MEITLQGGSTYGKDWPGVVEVSGFQLFQMRRLVGSRNVVSLFRKILKILKSAGSPVLLPEWLKPEELDIGDFMQLVVGVTAMSKGRQVKKVFTCPHCESQQPRVIDIVSVFRPGKPEIPGGAHELKLGEEPVVCRNVRVGDFIAVHEAAEKLLNESWRPGVDRKPHLSLDYVRKAYAAFPVDDEEDLEDLLDQVIEVGMVAVRVEKPGDLQTKLAWLFSLRGDGLDFYNVLRETVANLSATLVSDYTTTCAECKKEFSEEIGVEDYFFGSRWTSSTRWSIA